MRSGIAETTRKDTSMPHMESKSCQAEQVVREILSPQKSRSLRLVPLVVAMVSGDTRLPDLA